MAARIGLGELEAGQDGLRALHKEVDGGILCQVLADGELLEIRQGQWGHRELAFGLQVQHCPARHYYGE
jgi:hypothetical protein